MSGINEDNLEKRIDEFVTGMFEFQWYCFENNLPETEENRKVWKRERNINKLLDDEQRD